MEEVLEGTGCVLGSARTPLGQHSGWRAQLGLTGRCLLGHCGT